MSENENMSNEELQSKIEKEAALFAQQNEMNEVVEEPEVVQPIPQAKTTPVTSLGKAQKFTQVDDDPLLAAEIGWKNVPLENLPSQGLFYEESTQIAIRAASVAEIRHWSTID